MLSFKTARRFTLPISPLAPSGPVGRPAAALLFCLSLLLFSGMAKADGSATQSAPVGNIQSRAIASAVPQGASEAGRDGAAGAGRRSDAGSQPPPLAAPLSIRRSVPGDQLPAHSPHPSGAPVAAASAPLLAAKAAAAAPPVRPPLSAQSLPQTLLDEVGRLQQPVPAAQVAAWKRELKASRPAAERGAWLHLWLGEWELARNEQPRQADWHFRQAQRLTNPHDRCSGLAAYDRAIGQFYEGAYGEASDTFSALLGPKGKSPGYDRRNCALWLRHAQACAGYHAERAKLGIPEPPRLDPLCGVASLAACLRSLALPSDRATLLGACRVTGEGSTLGDLLNAGRKLGLNARAVTADDRGLMALPKPLVAYVEQDHFVALVRADKAGVSYLCSDCGPWPGGRVDLTWAQWHALSPGLYLTLARRGSAPDALLQAALDPSPSGGRRASLRLSYGGPLAALHLGVHLPQAALPALRGHVARYVGLSGPGCGTKHDSLHCQDYVDSPMYSPRGAGSGPQQCDPVNLATGEEEYTPAPDLVVYNAHGPSVSFSRLYNSLRAFDPTGKRYNSTDFGAGWSHSYNYRILDSAPGSSGSRPVSFVQANGASTGITGAPSSAVQYCTVPNGAPFIAEWKAGAWSGAPYSSAYLILTLTDRSKWIFAPALLQTGTYNYDNSVYLLSQIQDRNGNSITLQYLPGSQGLLASIDAGSTRLLQLNRDASTGTVDSITDFHGHQVWYHVGNYANANVPAQYTQSYQELDNVSQVMSSSTPNASNPFSVQQGNFAPSASRWTYGYALVSNGYMSPGSPPESFSSLSSITVPSPASAGGTLSPSTAHINYGTNYVTSLVDANGNTTAFTQVDGTHTRVTVADRNGKVAYSYTVGFAANMSMLTKTDGTTDANGANTNVVLTKTYNASSADPFRPVSVTNGNGNTWQFVWDQYGNLHQTISPRKNAAGANLVTNYTWAFAPVGVSGIPIPTVVNSVSQTNAPVFGELQSMKQGAKAPTTYAYYDASFAGQSPYYQNSSNSGLIKSITMPLPGSAAAVNPTPSSFTYDPYGNVLTATTPGNNLVGTITTTYAYDRDGGDPAHNVPAYTPTYANNYGQPLTVTDNLGHVTHLRYDYDDYSSIRSSDQYGHLTTVYDALGNRTDVGDPTSPQNPNGYNLAGQILRKTYPATGQTGSGRSYTAFSYLYVGGPLASSQVYDESGNLVRQVLYAYGPEGEMLSASGSTEPVTHGYDALYRPVSLADGNGHATNYYYNPAGYLDSMTYPGYAGPAYPNISGPDSMRFTYDAAGNVATRTDGNGVTAAYDHVTDPESLLTKVQYGYPSGYAGSAAGNVGLAYDDYGRLSQTADGVSGTLTAGGAVATPGMTYAYDDLDNATSVQTAYTGLPVQQVQYSYWPDGSRSTMNIPAIAAATATPNGGQFYYTYDGAGRLAGLRNPYGEQTTWQYQPNDWPLSQTDANQLQSTYAFNARGQLTDLKSQSLSAPAGQSGSAEFSVPGSNGYDGAGNLLSVTASIAGGPAFFNGTTTYAYDGRDQLTQEQSGRGNGLANEYGYDPAGNPTLMRGVGDNAFGPDNQTTGPGVPDNLFAFDGNGNPGTGSGAPIVFDAENRLTNIGPQANAVPVAVAQGGDGLTRLLWNNADGSSSLWTVQSNGTVVLQKSYGRYVGWIATAVAAGPNPSSPTRILWNHSDGVFSLWTVDAAGNFTQTQYGPYPGWVAKSLVVGPDEQAHVLLNHPSDGQMSLWTVASGGGFTSANYGPFAGYTAINIAVGPDNIVHVLWTAPDGSASLWNMDGTAPGGYSFHNDGPFAGWTVRALTVGPAGDPSLRALWVRSDGAASVRVGSTAGLPNGAPLPVSNPSLLGPYRGWVPLGLSAGPDDEGHLLWDNVNGSASLWNISPNNAQDAVLPTFSRGTSGATMTATYRGDGMRASKSGVFGQSYFLYDGRQPVCELNGSGQVAATNTFGGGIISRYVTTASPTVPSQAGNTFYSFDERGNVAGRWNATGQNSSYSSDVYDAYGLRRYAGAGPDPWGYGARVGYYTDNETGLSLLTHRYYDPGTGRFLTRDPMGYGGGINLYGYVGNNPVNVWDPLGLCGGDDGEPGFWDAVGSGLNVGLKATGSALSFGLYDGGDAKCDPDFGTSKKLAGIGRDALIMAATAGTGEGAVAAEEGTEAVEAGAEGAEDVAGACLRCFTGETLVQMADGTTKPISEVRAGDRVKSRDPQTGKEEAKTVTATIKRQALAVVTVSLTDAKTGKMEALTCTPEHPLFVTGQGWVEAGSLGIGSSIVSRAGPVMTVASVAWHRGAGVEEGAGSGSGTSSGSGLFTVYNLTVEDDHTYFVGSTAGGTWVHNTECGQDELLYRISNKNRPETAERLDELSKEAEANPLYGDHGVSVRTADGFGRPPTYPSATRGDIEQQFPVVKSGPDSQPWHYTVKLPNPVTQAAADAFNGLFGK